MRIVAGLLSTVFFLSYASASVRHDVYHYEPQTAELRGTIELQTFPGRPGYESIKNGDEVERGWYLRLERPIEVIKDDKDADPNASTEKNIKILQMAMKNDVPTDQIPLGKEVCVSGRLFHAISGHHHSRVLIEVQRIGACH
jgi:hypothetical protein